MNWILSMNEFFTNKDAHIYTRNVTHKLYKLTYFTGLIKAKEDFECMISVCYHLANRHRLKSYEIALAFILGYPHYAWLALVVFGRQCEKGK
jgi:hypothetical protein